MKTEVKLPDKLSELLRVALVDLEKCERSKKYVVDMDRWHQPLDGKCHVCLAGAVLAQTIKIKPTRFSCGSENDDVSRKTWALDYLRSGMVSDAKRFMRVSGECHNRPVTDYHTDPKQFKADMRQLADDLEAAGL